MSRKRQHTGRTGEDLATDFLTEKGWSILSRNYRLRSGEIDIVADDHGTIVFIEVKTRRSKEYGLPEESVHVMKQRKIIQVASVFLASKGLHDVPVRFDVITVCFHDNGYNLNHILEAFDASDF